MNNNAYYHQQPQNPYGGSTGNPTQLPTAMLPDHWGNPILHVHTAQGWVPYQQQPPVYPNQQQMYQQPIPPQVAYQAHMANPNQYPQQQLRMPSKYEHGIFQDKVAAGFGEFDSNGNAVSDQRFDPNTPGPTVTWSKPIQNNPAMTEPTTFNVRQDVMPYDDRRPVTDLVSSAALNTKGGVGLMYALEPIWRGRIQRLKASNHAALKELGASLMRDWCKNDLYVEGLRQLCAVSKQYVAAGNGWDNSVPIAMEIIIEGLAVIVLENTDWLRLTLTDAARSVFADWERRYNEVIAHTQPTYIQLFGTDGQMAQQPPVYPNQQQTHQQPPHTGYVNSNTTARVEPHKDPKIITDLDTALSSNTAFFSGTDDLVAEIRMLQRQQQAETTVQKSQPSTGAFPNASYGINQNRHLDDVEGEQLNRLDRDERKPEEPLYVHAGSAQSVLDTYDPFEDIHRDPNELPVGLAAEIEVENSNIGFIDEVRTKLAGSAKASQWQLQLDEANRMSETGLLGATPENVDVVVDDNEDENTGFECDAPESVIDYHEADKTVIAKSRTLNGNVVRPVYLARKQRLIIRQTKPNPIIDVEEKSVDYALHETEMLGPKKEPFTGGEGNIKRGEEILDKATRFETEDYYRDLIQQRIEDGDDADTLNEILNSSSVVALNGYTLSVRSGSYAEPIQPFLGDYFDIPKTDIDLSDAVINYSRFTNQCFYFKDEEFHRLLKIQMAEDAATAVALINSFLDIVTMPLADIAKLRNDMTAYVNKYLRTVFHPDLSIDSALNDFDELYDYLVAGENGDVNLDILNKIYLSMTASIMAAHTTASLDGYLLESEISSMQLTPNTEAILGTVENITLLPFNYVDYPLAVDGVVGSINQSNLPKLYEVLTNIIDNLPDERISKYLLVTTDNVVIEYFPSVVGDGQIYITRQKG